jgi:hypothetical protein
MKQLHPLRVSKYVFADRMNPFMAIFKTMSPVVKRNRKPVSPDNPLLAFEKKVSEAIVAVLGAYQDTRDHFDEALFFAVYESPWMKLLYPEKQRERKSFKEQEKETRKEEVEIQEGRQQSYGAMEKGGYEEGLIRMVVALEDSDHTIDRDALYRDERLLESSVGFKKLDKNGFMHLAQEQARILETDEENALKSLPNLIPTPERRKAALAIAKKIISSEATMSDRQKAVLSRISKALKG